MNASHLVMAALALAWVPGAAQAPASPQSNEKKPDVTVRLEPHGGQTHFKIGDRIRVDLVFTGPTPAYSVETDDNPYLSVRDVFNVTPDGGWSRSHVALLGQGQNGNASAYLDHNPVRVPILMNRAVAFLKPGHYEVTVTTDRLSPTDWLPGNPSTGECDRCRTTNPLGLDIAAFDESQEPALVASLSRKLEEPTPHGAPQFLPADQTEKFRRQIEALQANADSTEDDRKKIRALMRQMNEAAQKADALSKKRSQDRRETAERLAYLPGNAALRAKVHFIAADPDNGEPDPVGRIMVSGLPSTRNVQLQETLLEHLWRDPQHVPTSILQSALRQARELVRRGWVTDDQLQWAGTDEERKAAVDEYQNDINEIIGSLPLRTEENRTHTIEFLKKLSVPNPFNQQRSAGVPPA